ncbi:unnamed protein product [Pleuronectes platessa]|uniref:Uncharacterized protein n=1 Tax=Pleuronectes platessa TaxID=8262 RepID=A0A9N7YLW3_PLEPL|nr:unnamed protein product [Pleuronectes platessa]
MSEEDIRRHTPAHRSDIIFSPGLGEGLLVFFFALLFLKTTLPLTLTVFGLVPLVAATASSSPLLVSVTEVKLVIDTRSMTDRGDTPPIEPPHPTPPIDLMVTHVEEPHGDLDSLKRSAQLHYSRVCFQDPPPSSCHPSQSNHSSQFQKWSLSGRLSHRVLDQVD